VRLVLALLAISTLAACGPIQSTAALIDADVEIEAARAAGAAQSSPYELTGAVAYLKKAREVTGRAQYEAATRFARKSVALAKEARENAVAASNRGPETQENP
jgi:outer membrane biogenesis lipoprotein LolB